MAVQLDELERNHATNSLLDDGLDTHVIPKRIAVTRTPSHKQVKLLCRLSGVVFLIISLVILIPNFPNSDWAPGLLFLPLTFLPSLILWSNENRTKSYFEALQQSINQAASQVDIYIDHRVTLMKSLARTVDKGLEQELHVMLGTAAARGSGDADLNRIYINEALDKFSATVEAYPDIKSNQYIVKLMDQDIRCMSEITAARVLYNDKVGIWNREIFQWAIKQIVSAEQGYSTRIPFIVSSSVKTENTESLF